jgi:hypothetical protein
MPRALGAVRAAAHIWRATCITTSFSAVLESSIIAITPFVFVK